MRLKYKNYKQMLKACLGEIPSDMAITNAQIVNVFTGEILKGTVHVFEGFICHVDYSRETEINSKNIVNANEAYLIPGLIDSHVHIESSMMTPRNFAKAVIPWGTTTVMTDPHEMANVLGVKGVEYMLEASEGLPMRQFVDIPSCVPAVPSIEKGGADFTAKEISHFVGNDRVIGLGEVMDFLAVVHGEDRMNDILKTASDAGLYLQGHAPNLPERMLSAYLAAGPKSCHESFLGEDALKKLRNGMYVDARESSITRNVKDIWNSVKHFRYYDTLTLCTDDREADDILKSGHINDVINCAVKYGMNVIDAIKSVTINTARQINVENLGAIAPGFVADFLIVPDLKKIEPSHVYFEGELVAHNRVLLKEIPEKSFEIEDINTIKIQPLSTEDFCIKAPIENGTKKLNVMAYIDNVAALTVLKQEDFTIENGLVVLPDDKDVKFVAVINRYNLNRMAVYPIRGFGSTSGAVASTISHDCHNVVVVYDSAEDALCAVQELAKVGGGFCSVLNEKILCTLPLPVGGLLSKLTAEELAEKATEMKEANRKLGMTMWENPLLRIVTVALPVIPDVKMSDVGLIDVHKKSVLPVFVESE